MRVATPEELENWDALIQANPGGGEILQTRTWGEFKGRHGWKPHYLIFDELKLAALFLEKQVPGLGKIWYCPKGPGVASIEQLNQVGVALVGAKPNVFAIKVEPELEAGEALINWVKSPNDVHISQATVVIDLEPSEADLLADFKQKTRYNIRLAERHEVRVRRSEFGDQRSGGRNSDFEALYHLIKATQARGGFALRSFEYCTDYWQSQITGGQGQIFMAEYQGVPVAGVFVTFLGDKAWYKDGGSDRTHSAVMAPYLVQWEVMRWLKEHGIKQYDLLGMPRNGDLESSLQGLVQFKSGFNGQFKEFIGTWDLPLVAWRYQQWRQFGEKAILAYNNRIKRNLWY